MQACLQLICQELVHGAMALDAAHRCECVGNDADTEMCFTRAVEDGVVTGLDVVVTGMLAAFVKYDQPLR